MNANASSNLVRPDRSSAVSPDSVILSWLSIPREETEQYQQWTDFFSAFIARSPDYALAYHLRAESLWYGGKFREALADYSSSLVSLSNSVPTMHGYISIERRPFAIPATKLRQLRTTD